MYNKKCNRKEQVNGPTISKEEHVKGAILSHIITQCLLKNSNDR